MTVTGPRNIQTYLLDGTFEGVRIIELSESSAKAFVVPRLKLADLKAAQEYVKFRPIQDKKFESDFDRSVQKYLKKPNQKKKDSDEI